MKAAECLDLTDVPDPARRIVGRELAFKLKEVLDRNLFVIFQDLPDTSVGLPLEALVHKEGRITAERQAAGKRKGQWLFNRATVRSVDRLYDAFESKPLVPELAAIGRTAGGPAFRLTPGLWVRHRVPDGLRSRVGASGPWSLAVYQLVGLVLLVLLIVPVYHLVVRPIARLLRSLMSWRGVPADDRELRSWVRPIGWLAVAWMLVEGVTILDLRIEAAGPLLAVLVPAYWLAAALAAYQLIDPILKLVAGPALTRAGGDDPRGDGLPGAVPGAQDPGGRLRAGGAAQPVRIRRRDRARGPGDRRPCVRPGRAGHSQELLRFADAHRRPHVPGRGPGPDRRE